MVVSALILRLKEAVLELYTEDIVSEKDMLVQMMIFFSGSAKGEEAIMRIMDTLEVSDLMNMKGKYARIATKGWGSSVKIIGNITKDKRFDYESFFKEDNQCKS